MSNILPTCPEDCTAQIPPVNFQDCAPETNAGQVYNIYITNIGNPLTDWEDLAEWTTRLSNSSTNANAIRKFHVIGDKPAPETQEKEISHGRLIVGAKKHTINIKIDETNATNQEMLRSLECGGQYLMWYESSGGLLWGGDEGIEVSLKLDEIIPESTQDLILFQGTAKWTSKFTPERIVSPFA